MSSTGFRNPWVLDPETNEVVPTGAAKSGRVYRCPAPECGGELRLRAAESQQVRAHFAHVVEQNCSPESALHHTAKRLVRQVVLRWVAGDGPAPQVSSRCRHCKGPMPARPLPAGIVGAELEVDCGDYRLDVGLLGDGSRLMAAVEIRATHEIGPRKRAWLEVRNIRVAELDAEEVLRDPLKWRTVSGFSPQMHPECRNNREQDAKVQEEKTRAWKRAAPQRRREEQLERQRALAKKKRNWFRVATEEATKGAVEAGYPPRYSGPEYEEWLKSRRVLDED